MNATQPWPGPGALVRFGPGLVSQVVSGQGLGAVAAGAAAVIAIGAGSYGFVFGLWRAPEQAWIAALKLPLVMLSVAAASGGAGAALAAVLGTGLSARQSLTLLLVGLACGAALLGSLAPVAALFALQAPVPDPAVVGLGASHPAAGPSLRVHHTLLLGHVAMIGLCSTWGMLRLRAGLVQVIGDPARARAVWMAWMLVAAAVGAELSWLARPFQGAPTLPPGWFRAEPLAGNFFESVWRMLQVLV